MIRAEASQERGILRRISLKWLFFISWIMAILGNLAIRLYWGMPIPDAWDVELRVTLPWAAGLAGLVTLIVKRLQDEPTKEERVAFWALVNAAPGTVGVVLVTKDGVSEVVATVRSREEYLQLAALDKLPLDHKLFIAEDA